MTPAQGRKVPFFRSLQMKYALSYIVVIGAVLVLLNTYPVLSSQALVFQSKQNSLLSQAAVLSSSLGVSDTLTTEGVGQAMEVLGKTSLTRMMVIDPAGLILYDSAGEQDLYRYALFSEVSGALSGRNIFRSEYHSGAFSSRAAMPITYRNLTIGAVYLWEVDAEQGALLTGVQATLQTISLVICVLVLLFSVLFSKALARRFEELLRAMGIVREGEYSHRLTISGHDELSLLADEFNSLTGRLQITEEARRRFVSDASHELKTPLASIRLLTDSILQSPEIDTGTVQEFVADIGEEADRLTRISEKLLTLTRLDTAVELERTPVAVDGVIEKVRRMLAPLARAGQVEIFIHCQPHCLVPATQDDLYQVAFNLMENAVKYTLPGGRVEVTLTQEGDQVTLAVADTGVGIPAEDRDKIFDRFYRVDKARSRAAGGTGLGLSIVKDTVTQHGGRIRVDAGQPEGTVFTVTFPLWKEGEP